MLTHTVAVRQSPRRRGAKIDEGQASHPAAS
jgi:hypothetical protein